MDNKIYIRADGSPEIGLGHIVRCMALAQMLKEDFIIHFVSKEIPENLVNEINENGFYSEIIPSEERFFSMLSGNEIVVLDHYGLDSTYQKKIKEIGSKLVCIDDLHDKEFFADLIINHSPGIYPKDYKAQSYTKYALGPEYALLRPVFLEAAGIKKEIEGVETVLICFGGSDFKNLTKEVLQVVEKNDKLERITVVLGAAYPYRESLDGIIKNNPKIKVLNSLDEKAMFSVIRSADLAIIPASGILFEVIAGGCIPLICYYADNQKELFNYFKKNKTIPSFNAIEFDEEELNMAISDIIKGTIKIEQNPLRKKIGASSSNNLKNFKQLNDG